MDAYEERFLDPLQAQYDAIEREAARWDEEVPDWEEMSTDPEERPNVDYWDVRYEDRIE